MSKKLITACVATLLLFAVCGFTLRPVKTKAQDRTVLITSEDFPLVYQNREPVKILAINLAERKIESGQQTYVKKDSWMQDLRVTVKNVSDQTIKQITLNLHVGDRMIHMQAGRDYKLSKQAKRGDDVTIKPGETLTISYDEKKFLEMKHHFEHSHSFDMERVNRVKVSLCTVIFEDLDHGWVAPRYVERHGLDWRPDPEKPYTDPSDSGMLKNKLMKSLIPSFQTCVKLPSSPPYFTQTVCGSPTPEGCPAGCKYEKPILIVASSGTRYPRITNCLPCYHTFNGVINPDDPCVVGVPAQQCYQSAFEADFSNFC